MKIKELKKYLGLKDTPAKDKTADDLAMEIGTMITELRIIKGLTQEKLAEKIETKQPSIARIENGSCLPSLNFLFRIAKSLNTYLIPPKFGTLEESKALASTSISTAEIHTPTQYITIGFPNINIDSKKASSLTNSLVYKNNNQNLFNYIHKT